jgi:ubiquinone/menaquinone biosynthesis C-methylase UbiE
MAIGWWKKMAEPASVSQHVAHLYDSNPAREWERMDRHRTEFALTLRALAQYLPPPPARVLDCGGGPGRYAVELARQGYRVTLFDLSAGNLALAQRQATEAGVSLDAFEHGNALDLSRFAADSFDAVLLMGPLYHLLEQAERVQALAEATRVLQPGGPLFAAFISRFAAHRDAAVKYPAEPVDVPGLYDEIERSGKLPPSQADPPIFSAYFAHPTEVAPACWAAGLEVAQVLGLEGFVSIVEDRGVNTLSGPAWQWWVEANWRVAADPAIHGAVEHLLVVAHKPRWRPVLAAIARALDAAGVRFTISGGAALALHGIPIAVRDVDLITDRTGVYQFQELFSAQATEPVRYLESADYRSHFGRFAIDGVTVEVMAELEWREGARWLPINAATATQIKVEGALMAVAWAEEEFLAYIRRGRLERAAFMLPHLDRDRVLALLRGEVKSGMI